MKISVRNLYLPDRNNNNDNFNKSSESRQHHFIDKINLHNPVASIISLINLH